MARAALQTVDPASYVGGVTDPDVPDPEDVTRLREADLAEVEIDETPDDARPHPLEADSADVAEQRRIERDEDDHERLDEFDF